MRNITKFSRHRHAAGGTRHGSTLVIITMLLPVALAIAAFAINVVYMELARTELQITTDVATRAAARTLSVTGDQHEAVLAAERLLNANPFANQTMTLSGVDIVFGVSSRTSEEDRYSFTPDSSQPNAVQIQSNGAIAVPMLFPSMGVPVDFRPFKAAISTQSELDIAIVVDRSGSMAYSAWESANSASPPAAAPPGWTFGQQAPPHSRWLDAEHSIEYFLQLLEASVHSELVSLSSYSSSASAESVLSPSYGEVRSRLTSLGQFFHGGSTNIGEGILTGVNSLANDSLARPWASRVIVLLTDGIHNTGFDPLIAAGIAADEHIVIFTITFSDEADTTTMAAVADLTGGKHFHAATATQLDEAFKSISDRLPMLLTF